MRESLICQIEEVEKTSGISLWEDVMRSDMLEVTLSKVFPDMASQGGIMLKRISEFIFRDIADCNGCVVFIDGGCPEGRRLKNGVNYRELLAKHIAYAAIMVQIQGVQMVKLDEMLAGIDFDKLVQSASSYAGSSATLDLLSKPHVLMIMDVTLEALNCRSKMMTKSGEADLPSAINKMRSFFDQLVFSRTKGRKITIFTCMDSFTRCSSGKVLFGSRISDMLDHLHLCPNEFDMGVIETYECCRLCLVTPELSRSFQNRIMSFEEMMRIALDSTGVACEDLPELSGRLRDTAKSMSADVDKVFQNLSVEISNCMKYGDQGKTAIEEIIANMRDNPASLVAKKG